MSLPALDNLVRIHQLKVEPRNVLELARLVEISASLMDDVQALTEQ